VAVVFWRMLAAGGDNVSTADADDATDPVERGTWAVPRAHVVTRLGGCGRQPVVLACGYEPRSRAFDLRSHRGRRKGVLGRAEGFRRRALGSRDRVRRAPPAGPDRGARHVRG